MWDAKPKHPQTDWVLCSDDWQGLCYHMYTRMNDTPIKDNYADISLKEIKNANFKHSGQKRSYQKQL